MSSGKFRQILGLVLLASLACLHLLMHRRLKQRRIFRHHHSSAAKHLSDMSPETNPNHSIRRSVTANLKRDSTWRFTKDWLNTTPRHLIPNQHSPNAGTSTTTHLSSLFTCDEYRSLVQRRSDRRKRFCLHVSGAQPGKRDSLSQCLPDCRTSSTRRPITQQRVFVRDPQTGQFLLARDFDEESSA